MKILILLLCVWGISPGQHPVTFKFTNGYWFNGIAFEQRDMYVKDGVFSDMLAEADTTVDLEGKYVIPPYSETHTHMLEGIGNYEETIKKYIDKGVFYVKNPNNIRPLTEKLRPFVNKPHSIDAVFANGGLTCSGGHPEILYEEKVLAHLGNHLDGISRGWFKGKSYFNIDSRDDLEKQWPLIKDGRPDFIKIYFANEIGRASCRERV